MEGGWQMVYYSNLVQNIEIIRAALTAQDIKSVAIDKRDSSYVFVGDIEVFVPEKDAILAKIIIDQTDL